MPPPRKAMIVVPKRDRCGLCSREEHPCDVCIAKRREWNRLASARRHARRRGAGGLDGGKVRDCFRCLGRHVIGERNCPLAAEYVEPVKNRREEVW